MTTKRPPAQKSMISRCGGIVVRGTARQIATRYVDLAKDVDDDRQRQTYLQHAEHYIRQAQW